MGTVERFPSGEKRGEPCITKHVSDSLSNVVTFVGRGIENGAENGQGNKHYADS